MSEAEQRAVPVLTAADFSTLKDWSSSDHDSALAAFRRSAREMLGVASGFQRDTLFGGTLADWRPSCVAALSASDARSFFEEHFHPWLVSDAERPAGLFTGYYEPEVEGSRVAGPDFPVPVYRKPPDLVAFDAAEEAATGLRYGRRPGGKPEPYLTRKDIENGALSGRGLEICWLRSWVDAFFMHIQGSGRVRLSDGGTIRLSYAAKSGHPYTGIGGVLADRGILTRATMSMQTVRRWMAENPDAARELMWINRSYVFFREADTPDDTLGAIGAAKVQLTPFRSMAVDRRYWMFGTPFWIETEYPPESLRQDPAINRLMIAQDTGSAIKGAVRGDFYWGWGEEAAFVAGHMKNPGRATVLLPHGLCDRLGLVP